MQNWWNYRMNLLQLGFFYQLKKKNLTTAQQRGIREETFFSKVDMPGSFRGVLYELHLSWNLSSKTIRHFSVDKWQLHFTDDTTNAWTLTNNFSVRWNNWSWHFYTWMVVSIFDLLTQNCRKLFENVWYIGKMRASFKICL